MLTDSPGSRLRAGFPRRGISDMVAKRRTKRTRRHRMLDERESTTGFATIDNQTHAYASKETRFSVVRAAYSRWCFVDVHRHNLSGKPKRSKTFHLKTQQGHMNHNESDVVAVGIGMRKADA